MKRTVILSANVLFACCLGAATNCVEKTMVVKRCIAVDGSGVQCAFPAEKDKDYCWRHCKAVRVVNETINDAGKETKESWRSTKQWSSNSWEKTKSSAQATLDNAKKAVDSARVGLVEMFGGKDAKNGTK